MTKSRIVVSKQFSADIFEISDLALAKRKSDISNLFASEIPILILDVLAKKETWYPTTQLDNDLKDKVSHASIHRYLVKMASLGLITAIFKVENRVPKKYVQSEVIVLAR